ncbi:MAG: hypothetical protein J5988_11400, partial [Eubacterium sp.]|nr:hypothetical protein [Eubacterium sp.]
MKRKKCLQTGFLLAFLAAGTMMAACAVPEQTFVETTGKNSSEYVKEITEEDSSQVSEEPTGGTAAEYQENIANGEKQQENPSGQEA